MTATPTPPEGQPDPAPEKPEPRNVIEAVARIMAELPGIGKDSKAAEAQGGYAYRGIEAITAATQRLLGRYGVVFTPRVLKVEIEAITVNGKPWTDTHLTVEYVVRGPGWDPTAPEGTRDEIVVGPLHAIGRDNTDKGSNKAMTQAFKYALIQTFCQPTGTLVRIPVAGAARRKGEGVQWIEVPIESLRPGDQVVSWQTSPSAQRVAGRTVIAVRSRPYDGRLVTMQAGDACSRFTPDHHSIVRLGPLTEGNYITYLMRRGDQYRVGMTTWLRPAAPSKTTPHWGLVERLADQGADAAWVLSVHGTAAEAAMIEALTVARFGIPGVMFRSAPERGPAFDPDSFWQKVGPNEHQAEACLAYHGLLPGRPLLRRPAAPADPWLPLDGVAAANVRSGMLVPIPGAFDPSIRRWRMRWVPVTVGETYYCGLVHSLDVDGDHTYIGDGIGTHNCIGDPKDDADSGSPATDERGQARQGQAKQPEGPPWWEVRGFESEERAQATVEALRASIEKLDADGKEAVAEWLVSHGFVFPDDPEIPEERRGKHRLGVVTADAAKEIEELILVVTPPTGDGETVDPANEAGSGPPVGSQEPAAPEPGDGASAPEAAAQGSTGRRPRTPR